MISFEDFNARPSLIIEYKATPLNQAMVVPEVEPNLWPGQYSMIKMFWQQLQRLAHVYRQK